MKILVVSEQYWPEGGGGTLATHLILKFLSQACGVNIFILSGTRKPAKISKNIKYFYTSFLECSNKILLWRNLFLLAKQKWFLKLLSDTDVLYIPRYCYPLIPLGKRLNKKVIVHLHDYQPVSYNAVLFSYHINNQNTKRSKLRNCIKYELLEHNSVIKASLSTFLASTNVLSKMWITKADKIICVSRKQFEIICHEIPNLARKTRVIYNLPPNIPHIEKQFNKKCFLYMGGDSFVKGYFIFLKASWILLNKGVEAKYLLGEGRGFKLASRSLIKKLNKKFNSAYILLGRLKYNELLKHYVKSLALIFPSVWEEPLPYVVIESMLAGTIPIASKIGGVPEIVGDTPAQYFLVEPYDIDGFVDRMECILSLSNEELTNIGIKLRNVTQKKFNVEKITRDLFRVFNLK